MSDWTRGEIEVVAGAVQAAPSVHNTVPWELEFHHDDAQDDAHGASLFERFDRALPRHDPRGRDRLISCGAALENLVLAMRILGWAPELTLLPRPGRPDEVARVRAGTRQEPSDVDLARYAAIPHRHSVRRPFTGVPVEKATRDALVAASHTAGVEVRAIGGRDAADVLARVLGHAALVLKADRAYQRELSAWTATGPDPAPGAGVANVAGSVATLPWAGLVRRSTAVPDHATFAARLRRECLLLVETPDDGPLDQIRAGRAVQATWLAATAAGLAGSVLTQPLQVHEVRAGLIEGLDLAGFPQALLRFGYPKEDPS
jgi:nitroreductase